MDISQITSRLAGLAVPAIQYFEQTGSTNDDAARWIMDGAPDGSLVVADLQTSGRGRLSRRWVTQPGSALAFSLVFRPTPSEEAVVGLFTALGALAISRALETHLGIQSEIKWPNDILLNRKKAAGILVETNWVGNSLQGLVMGIGINISPKAVPPPDQLLYPAASVEDAAGRPVDRLDLLREVISQVIEWRPKISDPVFRSAWDERLAFKGEWVTIREAGDRGGVPLSGKVVGIDPSGRLVLRLEDGKEIPVAAGDVQLRPKELN